MQLLCSRHHVTLYSCHRAIAMCVENKNIVFTEYILKVSCYVTMRQTVEYMNECAEELS